MQPGIETPRARPCRRDPQKDEGVQRRLFAAVGDREKTTRRPAPKVGDSHFAAEDECGRTRKHAQRDQRTADRFQNAADAANGPERRLRPRAGKAEQLLQSVLPEQQPSDDTNERDGIGHASH